MHILCDSLDDLPQWIYSHPQSPSGAWLFKPRNLENFGPPSTPASWKMLKLNFPSKGKKKVVDASHRPRLNLNWKGHIPLAVLPSEHLRHPRHLISCHLSQWLYSFWPKFANFSCGTAVEQQRYAMVQELGSADLQSGLILSNLIQSQVGWF